MFRRMKSPRSVEFRNTSVAGVGSVDKQNQPIQTSEELNKRKDRRKGKRFSEHRRHRSDELNSIVESTEFASEPPTFLSQSEEVVDYQLSDPSPFPVLPPPQLPPRHRGGSGSTFNLSRSVNLSRPGWRRTQSSGTMSSPKGPQPPHQEYFVPADTLRNVQRTSFVPVAHNGAVGGPTNHHLHSSSKDKRNLEMHNKIVAQNDPTMLNKRKSRSLENLIDTSDYSLPFDVVPERSDSQSKSRSPEGQAVFNLSQPQTTRSDSNLTMHNTSTPPAKPRRTRDFNPPAFAPPPPPSNEEERVNSMHSPTVVRRGDDYEEPWNSSKFHLPRPHSSRRQRTETVTPVSLSSSSNDTYKSPRPHRSHTINHETSPEPEFVPGVPPRKNRSETTEGLISHHSLSPQLDTHRPRTTTGEPSDYCIPPDAILHDGVSNGGGVLGWGGDQGYVNQPPIPVRTDMKQKHRYPPLLPSEHYITDIQNLPPPAFPIETAVPLEEQP